MAVIIEEVNKLLDNNDADLLSCYQQHSKNFPPHACMTFAASKEKVEYVEVNDIVNPLDKELRACLEKVIERLDVKSLSIELPYAYMVEVYFSKGHPYR